MKNQSCPTCGGTKLVKNGLGAGKQCLKCKSCGRLFVISRNDFRISEQMKEQMLRCLSERNSMRSVCCIFEVSMGWFYRFMIEHWKEVSNLNFQITPEMKSKDADFEVDELCTYVKNVRFGLNLNIP